MATLRIERLVGEITHGSPEGRARQHGAFHSSNPGERQLGLVRPLKKRDRGCKACDGRHCVGRCRF